MYTRFFRWASDRVADDGVIAFITGRKPLSKAAYDGFRKIIARDFAEVWVVDLGGDVRDNVKLSGTKHNVFGIQIGIAIWFLVRRRGQGQAAIRYVRRPEFETAEDKLAFLGASNLRDLTVETLRPDRRSAWIEQAGDLWAELPPLASKDAKGNVVGANAIFELYSRGLETHRDEWVYDESAENLYRKINSLITSYESVRAGVSDSFSIKWDRELDKRLQRNVELRLDEKRVICAAYRPFINRYAYFDRDLNAFLGRLPEIFLDGRARTSAITLMGDSSDKPYFAFAVNRLPDLNFVSPGSGGTQTIPRYRYVGVDRIDNITDWALDQFTGHYGPKVAITKDDIFHYVYAVLHDPVYRETYALNLRREFPRIPFYPDFQRWAGWGKTLMDLHIGYETVEPWPLERVEVPLRAGAALKKGRSKDLFEEAAKPSAKKEADTPKVRLKADKDTGVIELDAATQLTGVPPAAWTYRLGNRSAIEWVLDQHKEKKPSDPTIREKFDTYRFADHKEKVIDLLRRVTRVSVETMAIVEAMRAVKR